MKSIKKKPTNSTSQLPHMERAKSQKSFSQLQNNPDITANQDSKKLVKDGQRYLKKDKQNVDEALNKFQEAIEKDPNNGMAYQGRGKCLFMKKHYKEALDDFLMALNLDKRADKKIQSEHASLAAYTYIQMGKHVEAIEYFTQAIKFNKDAAILYFYRAQAKQDIQKYEEAVEDYIRLRAVERNLTPPNIFPQEMSFRELQCQAYFNTGVCYHKLNRIAEAIEELKKVTELQPERSEAHNQLGLSFLSNLNFEEALLSFNRAIQQDPEPEYYCNRGITYFEVQRNDDALRDFKWAIDKNPNVALFYFYRGDVYLKLQQFDEAHLDYDRALELDDTQPKYYHSKGLAFEFEAKDLPPGDKKQELLNQAIEMQKLALHKSQYKFERSEYHLGLMFHQTNEFHFALRHLSNVVEQASDNADVYVARGKVYQDMGTHQFALKDFDKALKLRENDPTALYYRGISKMMCKYYDEALKDFRNANLNLKEEQVPGDLFSQVKQEFILDGQGSCYHALNMYDDAIDFFNQALQLDGKNVKFLMNRSLSYSTLGQNEQAINDLMSALSVKPEDPQILYMLGLAYYSLPNYKRCIKTLKKSIKAKPFISYEADIYYHVALAYCRLGKFERSLYPFSVCIKKIPSDIRYIHERAKAYQMIEFHQDALLDFNKVIQKNPKNAHAFFRRGFTNKALGNYKEAADDFEKAKELDPLNPALVINYKKMKGINCIVLCEPGEEKDYN